MASIELLITLKDQASEALAHVERALMSIRRVARLALRRRLYRKTWRVRK